jgi:hypothetical protein
MDFMKNYESSPSYDSLNRVSCEKNQNWIAHNQAKNCYCTFLSTGNFLSKGDDENPISHCSWINLCDTIGDDLEASYDNETYRCSPQHIAKSINNMFILNKLGIDIDQMESIHA